MHNALMKKISVAERMGHFPVTLSVIFLSFTLANSARASETMPLGQFLSSIAPPPADEALDEIPDIGRKLLALRSYVRARSYLVERWSWSDEKIKDFQGSAAQQALLAEVAAVGAYFAQANPGYEIYANTKVRSLDTQIVKWNSNVSVGIAAVEIYSKWKEHFNTNEMNEGNPDPEKLRRWLSGFVSTKRANLAAPGLTLHGRALAIDFQIMRNGKIIAGANSKQIDPVWRAHGWDIKLKESMDAAGPLFEGPLTSPDEPWHFNYHPAAHPAQQKSVAGR